MSDPTVNELPPQQAAPAQAEDVGDVFDPA